MRTHHFLAILTALLVVSVASPRATAGDGDKSDGVFGYDSWEDTKGGVCCDTCCPTGPDAFRNYLPQIGRLQFYGWLDGGIVGNTSNPVSGFNGPYNAVDLSNQAMFNQGYLVSEIGLPCDGSFGFGARADLLYGEDFLLAQSLGWEVNPDFTSRWNSHEYYGLAMPQLYVEAGRKDLSLQVGHFYSIVGYEGVMAPYNFFYTKSYSYQFAGPFQHWGAQVNWQVNDAWQVQAGLINGWDALDRVQDSVNLIAKVKYASDPCGGWWSSFAIITGDEYNDLSGQLPAADQGFTNRTRYSWIVDLPITCRLEYLFHHWLGYQEAGAPGAAAAAPGTPVDAYWYGVDQYLYYTVDCHWKVGARFEWFRDEDGTRVGLNRPSNPNNPPFIGNFWSLSAGINWTPTSNLSVRPEVRWDWFDGAGLPYDDGAKDNQVLFAADVIWRF